MKRLTQLATITMCILLGAGVAMADKNLSTGEENVLILDAEPLATTELLKTVDITSTEETLGDGDKFKIVNGKISIGRPLVYKLTKPKPGFIGQQSENFYLVEFRFTLHPPETKRRYEKMELKIQLSNPEAVALQLLPTSVETEADVSQTFDIGFSIALPDNTASAEAKMGQTVAFKQLIPVITAFGDGDSGFYWIYAKPKGADTVVPGSRKVAAVIAVPDGSRSLSATIQCTVELYRSFFDEWMNIPVSVEPITMNLPLL